LAGTCPVRPVTAAVVQYLARRCHTIQRSLPANTGIESLTATLPDSMGEIDLDKPPMTLASRLSEEQCHLDGAFHAPKYRFRKFFTLLMNHDTQKSRPGKIPLKIIPTPGIKNVRLAIKNGILYILNIK
jgi:hypothetical protein